MNKKVFLAMAAASLTVAGQAQAATLSFSAEDGKSYVAPATFADQGFTFSYSQNSSGAFAVVGKPALCGPACVSNGVDAFYSFNSGTLSLAATNGAGFTLDSLMLAQTFTNTRALDVLITGMRVGGGSVSEEITETSSEDKAFNTFVLPSSFTDLSSVSITGVGIYPTTEFAVDGITVSDVSAVPELPSAWLLASGLAATLALARRRRSARR
jgi:hypothetical protein